MAQDNTQHNRGRSSKKRSSAALHMVIFIVIGFILGLFLGGALGSFIPDGTSPGRTLIYFGLAFLAEDEVGISIIV